MFAIRWSKRSQPRAREAHESASKKRVFPFSKEEDGSEGRNVAARQAGEKARLTERLIVFGTLAHCVYTKKGLVRTERKEEGAKKAPSDGFFVLKI